MPKKKLSTVLNVQELNGPAQSKSLSKAEVAAFQENGFLVKRALIDDRQLTVQALELAWNHLLQNVPMDSAAGTALAEDDPSSWLSPSWAKMPPPPQDGFYEGRQRIVYSGLTVKLHDIGDHRVFLDALPNHPRVRKIARHLLGEDLRPSARTRGVYAIFPHKDAHQKQISADSLGPHSDRVCQQLNVCTYLSEVPPRGGGFTLYPGSHKIMANAHKSESNWSPKPHFREQLTQVAAEITPVEIAASPGDVIFWHGRMVHSSGIHHGTNIRWAVFGDFMINGEVLSDDEHRAVGQYEWFKDTRLLRDDSPVGNDMWRNWRLASFSEPGSNQRETK